MSTRSDDIRQILPGLAALCVALALALDLITLKLVGFDFAAYILGARRLVAGEPLYQTALVALGPFGQYVYAPFVVLPFVPLAMLPFDVARLSFLLLLAGLAALVTWHLASQLPRATRYWGAAAIVLFFPLIWEVTLENLTLVTLTSTLLAWRWRRSAPRSGAAFAVALGLKLLPLSLIPYFLASGRVRVLLWSALGLIAITFFTWPIVGAEWPAFIAFLAYIAQAPAGTGSNIVPALFSAPPLRVVLPALALLIAVLCGFVSRASDGDEDHSFRVALAAVPLVASTLWYPYLIFALPLLVASGPRPPTSLLRVPFAVARPCAWVLMQWETLRDPGREFLMPMVGLLLLLMVGLLELYWCERTQRPLGAQEARARIASARVA